MKLIHTSATNSLAILLQAICPTMMSALVSRNVSSFDVARAAALSFTIAGSQTRTLASNYLLLRSLLVQLHIVTSGIQAVWTGASSISHYNPHAER